MLTNRLFSRSVLGAALLAASALLPAVAHAHDNNDERWEDHHRYHEDHHRGYWHQGNEYFHGHPWERRVYERRYIEPRVIEPQVYYTPSYVYPAPTEGVTIICRNRW